MKKLYYIEDLQGCNFMGDLFKNPKPLKEIKERFWGLDEEEINKRWKNFTKEYIENIWEVRFIEVLK